MSVDSGELDPREDEDSLEELQNGPRLTGLELDVEDFEDADVFDLPDMGIDQELEVKIIPVQSDEFICTKCFLVMRFNLNVAGEGKPPVCAECE